MADKPKDAETTIDVRQLQRDLDAARKERDEARETIKSVRWILEDAYPDETKILDAADVVVTILNGIAHPGVSMAEVYDAVLRMGLANRQQSRREGDWQENWEEPHEAERALELLSFRLAEEVKGA